MVYLQVLRTRYRLTVVGRCKAILTSLLVALLCVSWPAAAQDAELARRHEARGRRAFEAKQYRQAAEHFRRAFDAAPAAVTKYNEAYAWQVADEPARAADGYELALSLAGLEDKLREAAQERLATLKRQVGLLDIRSPIAARVIVAHANNAATPLRIHVRPGRHTITFVTGGGRSLQLTETVAAGRQRVIEPSRDQLSPPAPSNQTSASKPVPVSDETTTSESDGFWIAGWISLGATVPLGIATAVLGAQTLSTVDDFESAGSTDQTLHDEAVALRTSTNVMLAITAAAALTGTTLLLISSADEGPNIAMTLHPTGASGIMHWRF